MEVLKAQHDLEAEEKFLQHERRQHEENLNLRKQVYLSFDESVYE